MTLSPTKLPDKIRWSDVRKQRIRPGKIIWPVAPDGYIPNSVVRSFAPYPKFNRPTYCANKGLHLIAQVEEDKTLKWKKQFNYLLMKQFPPNEEQQNKEDHKDGLEHGIQSVPEKTNIGASLKPVQSDVETKTEARFALRRGVAQRQYFLQNRQKLLQQNATSVEDLQTNVPSVEDLQTNVPSVEDLQTNVPSVEDLQTDATSVEELQTNVPSVDELKSEEDGEKDFIHPPKENSNASPTKQAKKMKKGQKASFNLPEDLSLSPSLQQEKDEFQQEIASSIKEPKKSFQESRHVPEIGDPNRRRKIKSFVPPLLHMCDRRPGSLLMYLYKRSKA